MRPSRPISRASASFALPLASLVAVASLLCGTAHAKEPKSESPSASAASASAATKARAAIPEPLEDKGLEFEYRGDQVALGGWCGSFHLAVEVGEYRSKPVWLVTDEWVREFAGSTLTIASSAYLSRDLSVLRGEWSRASEEGTVRLTFRRDEERPTTMHVTRVVEREGEPPVESQVTLETPLDATFGRGAVYLLLRHAREPKGTFSFPVFDLESAIPTGDEHRPPPSTDPAVLDVRGAAKYGEGKAARDAFLAAYAHGPYLMQRYYLDASRKSLLGIDVVRPLPSRIVPKGEGGEKDVIADDRPSKSWKAAMMKFLHGYHFPDEALLTVAFHWPSMLAYDVSTKSWSGAADDTEGLKAAYIKEFVTRSKHRTRAVADELALGLLKSATIDTLPDGTVRVASHPEYGGNAYFLKEIEGTWYIVRIDQ